MSKCSHCNKGFEPTRGSKAKFCSYKCNGLYSGVIRRQKATVIKSCLCCAKEFKIMKGKIRKGEGKYCSYSCSAKMTKNSWKGDNVSYMGLHAWIRKKLVDPNKCEHCNKKNGRFPSGYPFLQWANKSGEYKRDKEDWLRLCVKCHKAYDMDRKELLCAQS